MVTGRVRSGGSTLSMQIARRLDPRPRTLRAKLVEAVRAVQLELRYPKDRLLADYLTLAPYGGSLEGVRAASLAYFGHEPSTLTDSEQALLIALPQAPERRRPDRRYGAALRARSAVLQRLVAMGLMTPAAAAEAQRDPLPRRRNFPTSAFAVSGGTGEGRAADQAYSDHNSGRRPAAAAGGARRPDRRLAGEEHQRRGAGDRDPNPRRPRRRHLGRARPARRLGGT